MPDRDSVTDGATRDSLILKAVDSTNVAGATMGGDAVTANGIGLG